MKYFSALFYCETFIALFYVQVFNVDILYEVKLSQHPRVLFWASRCLSFISIYDSPNYVSDNGSSQLSEEISCLFTTSA